MNKITELKNIVHQKFLKIAKRARIKEEDGKSTEHEFCCLMRLQALLIAIEDTFNPTVEQLKEMYVLANSICGRDRFLYKPVDWCALDFDAVNSTLKPAISACDIVYENPNLEADNETLCSYVDKIIDMLNYEFPWIKFIVKEGIAPGKYEVGKANIFSTVGITVNKTAKEFYDIDQNGNLNQYEKELKNSLPDQIFAIDFQNPIPQSFILHGEYFDLKKHLNKHEKAEAELKWESVWPCYVGVGPLTALDDLSDANTFIQSMTPLLDCKRCHEIDISEGNVLYYFFPFVDFSKEFVTENANMRGSYKGTIDNVRTKSMDDNNVPGGKTYGVIRTDQQGIRYLKFCVDPVLIEEEIPIVDAIWYETFWSTIKCSKETIIEEPVLELPTWYETFWSIKECAKDVTTDILIQPIAESYDANIQENNGEWVLTWFLTLTKAAEVSANFRFTTLIKDAQGQVIDSVLCSGLFYQNQTRYDSPLGGTIILNSIGLTGITKEIITNSLILENA
jgi:hypothetical protein